jgi:hypothetical protein
MPPRPERIPDRHGWNGLHHYLNIHESNMEDLRSYLIDDDTDLRIHLLDVNHFRIEGRVYCRFGIYVDIRKTLELNDLNQALKAIPSERLFATTTPILMKATPMSTTSTSLIPKPAAS